MGSLPLPTATVETISTTIRSSTTIASSAPKWAFPLLGATTLDWLNGTWAGAAALNSITGMWERSAVSPTLSGGAPLVAGEIYVVVVRPNPGGAEDPALEVGTITAT